MIQWRAITEQCWMLYDGSSYIGMVSYTGNDKWGHAKFEAMSCQAGHLVAWGSLGQCASELASQISCAVIDR